MKGVTRKKRVLLAKVGWDAHDIGIKIVARMLSEAGMEVVYLGLYNSIGAVINAVIEEDVDVLGLSILSGDHLGMVHSVLEGLKERGLTISVILGGVIPRQDVPVLEEKMGVKKVFRGGASLSSILQTFRNI